MNTLSDPASINLAHSVEYAANAIVSKTILKQTGGNITLFAFDKDEALSEHSSQFSALLQILEGNVQVTIAENLFNLTAGDAIILPANIPHAVKAIERFKMMLTMIK
jgi:quercetin dioxygenase-like cupin family protein